MSNHGTTEVPRKPQKKGGDTSISYEELSELTGLIIGAAIEVHKALGPGFSEEIYAKALRHELQDRGIPFAVEAPFQVRYRGQTIGSRRIDLLVGDEVIVELKVVDENSAHVAQTLSYLKVSGKKLGLILNFGKSRLGIKRVVL